MDAVLSFLRQYSTVRFSPAERVDAGPTSLTSSGMIAAPPTLSGKDDVLVNKGAAAPETCLSLVDIPIPTAADGLSIVGRDSTTIQTIFSSRLFLGATVNRPRKITVGQTTRIPLPWR